METDSQLHKEPQVREIQSGLVLLGRVTWMLVGPVALLLISYAVLSKGGGWFALIDAAFALVVVLMIAGRWIEQRSGSATTVTGEPATAAHFKRYVQTLLPVSAGLWVAANGLGNHVLS